ncbi:hypothetical protein BUALT_Bualt07G0122600 [Buddleja alternifolia]|uniref:Uncharacterized protein n=1 Tax=Buddleja alternifolia TaxID=168488 RepID=A0AAV6XIA6_9LAMI|nr:hypothetical protein BUALT_Bualt07G0122600 [Buddleja alternifolia]
MLRRRRRRNFPATKRHRSVHIGPSQDEGLGHSFCYIRPQSDDTSTTSASLVLPFRLFHGRDIAGTAESQPNLARLVVFQPFRVPKTLMITNPDCYIPQALAFGPYNHLRGELYDMEKYKLAAAKRNQRELENMKLEDIVDHLMKCELRIRANYHRPLGYNGEALAWMMAVDSSFLFEFLQVCGVKEDETLFSLLAGVSKEFSPFKMVKGSRKVDIKECFHFLDFLYKFIMPKLDVPSEIIQIHDEIREDNNKVTINSFSKPSCLRQFFDELRKILSKSGEGAMHNDDDEEKKDDDKEEEDKPPLMEEITIPSVTELVEVGVQFFPTKGDTENDAKLLCERGIILNHLKDEKQVTGLWNGMSKSIRLTKVLSLDKVIEDVNKFYNGRWKVKFGKFMKRYVFGSWKILTFVTAIMLLILTTLQAFCQVYNCARVLRIEGLEPAHV